MANFWNNHKVIVTGGAGFLGTYVVKELKGRGVQKVYRVDKDQYDLRQAADVIRMYEENSATMVIHLAATVGGIGINREHPGSFFYDNLMMGVLTMEYARSAGIEKYVAIGTICAYRNVSSS